MTSLWRVLPLFLLALIILVGSAAAVPSDDTYVEGSNPLANHGGSSTLQVGNAAGVSENNTILIRFDVNGVSASNIQRASIKLYFYNEYSGAPLAGRVLCVKRIMQGWDENLVTYDSMPSLAGQPTSCLTMPTSFGWVEFDVTQDVIGYLNGSLANYGWAIYLNESIDALGYFHSKEYSDPARHPQLVIVISSASGTTTTTTIGDTTITAASNTAQETSIIDLSAILEILTSLLPLMVILAIMSALTGLLRD